MSLIEVLIAFTIMTLVLLVFSSMFTRGTRAAHASRQEAVASRLAQTIHSRVLKMDFNQLFSVDTANKAGPRIIPSINFDYEAGAATYNFWAPWSTDVMTPQTLAILNELESEIKSAGFTRFTIVVRYMRRDSSDADNQGNVSDLRPFTRYYGSNPHYTITMPAGGSAADHFDPLISFTDRNSDGDVWDVVGGKPETPDTNMKLLTITIYNANRVIAIKHGDLITKEAFSGRPSENTESDVKLLVKGPFHQWGVGTLTMYQRDTAAKRNALDLPFFSPEFINCVRTYRETPSTNPACTGSSMQVDQHDVDFASHFRISGESEPGATIEIEGYTSSVPLGVTPMDTCQVGADGRFDCQATLVNTSRLFQDTPAGPGTSGDYTANVRVRARTEQGYYSPYVLRGYYRDKYPPYMSDFQPSTSTTLVRTRQPLIAVRFNDDGQNGTSGANIAIFRAFISTTAGATWVGPLAWDHNLWRFNLPGDNAYWKQNYLIMKEYYTGPSDRRGLPFVFNNGDQVIVRAEMADTASYKATTTWTFRIDIDPMDATPPDIDFSTSAAASVSKTGPATRWMAQLTDAESGINWGSLRYTLTNPSGTTITVSSATAANLSYMGLNLIHYYGNAFQLPVNTYSTGTHQLGVSVENWAGLRSTSSWSFTVVP